MTLRMKYFVLKPGGESAYAKASRAAMLRFAEYLYRTASDDEEMQALAKELDLWVVQEQAKIHGPISDGSRYPPDRDVR